MGEASLLDLAREKTEFEGPLKLTRALKTGGCYGWRKGVTHLGLERGHGGLQEGE